MWTVDELVAKQDTDNRLKQRIEGEGTLYDYLGTMLIEISLLVKDVTHAANWQPTQLMRLRNEITALEARIGEVRTHVNYIGHVVAKGCACVKCREAFEAK